MSTIHNQNMNPDNMTVKEYFDQLSKIEMLHNLYRIKAFDGLSVASGNPAKILEQADSSTLSKTIARHEKDGSFVNLYVNL